MIITFSHRMQRAQLNIDNFFAAGRFFFYFTNIRNLRLRGSYLSLLVLEPKKELNLNNNLIVSV